MYKDQGWRNGDILPSLGKNILLFNVFRCQRWHGGFLPKKNTGFAQRFLPSYAACKNIAHSENINY